MNDATRIAEARMHIPNLVQRLEALDTSRLMFLEARATCEAVRARNSLEAGRSPAILPSQAIKAGRLIGAVIRERRAAERRAAAELAAVEAATTPIAEAA
jgi:hypothetical protein